ncbi:MAG TPA: YdcF family protein [Gaiellaceae bacterium]|nr:YdcF family protein [Gaiellaceae bacterium]
MSLAIVVPGNGVVGRDGAYRISSACRTLVKEAERLVDFLSAETVIFSGWSPEGAISEADQMRDAWKGPDVELVVEPTARVTAQNASRTLPLLLDRGLRRAVVVCTPAHNYRTRFFFTRLYGPAGIETDFRLAPITPSLSALAWELLAIPVCAVQLRSARAEVAQILAR